MTLALLLALEILQRRDPFPCMKNYKRTHAVARRMLFTFLRASGWVLLAGAVELLLLTTGVRLLHLAWDLLAK